MIDLNTFAIANVERRARKEAASPGPWRAYHPSEFPRDIRVCSDDKETKRGYLFRLTHSHSKNKSGDADGAHLDPREEDADFIAAARNDPVEDTVDALLAEVKRLRELGLNLLADLKYIEQFLGTALSKEQAATLGKRARAAIAKAT